MYHQAKEHELGICLRRGKASGKGWNIIRELFVTLASTLRELHIYITTNSQPHQKSTSSKQTHLVQILQNLQRKKQCRRHHLNATLPFPPPGPRRRHSQTPSITPSTSSSPQSSTPSSVPPSSLFPCPPTHASLCPWAISSNQRSSTSTSKAATSSSSVVVN